ncbi:hypothetical protein [Candidatus Symbiopectobacterium sp. NZEC135]|uniref:hypothetical protein n=1 Tax=Candidatus Symbiopectobacterium sp. NZEC135 TaxID=2820471 RepID=UPI00222782CF|nr:hypothetical protein [Candidatus Symbiopectobacterium sp. NZEC135]MCW2479186.1 hypothetical protein [Candidatus Symbiopectobacterium sp. NZEC135]
MAKPTGKIIRVTPESIGAYTKAETDAKVSAATAAASNAAAAAGSANTNAESRVPLARKVNGKPLSADITLGAGDVGAYTKAETDAKVSAATTAASNAAAAAGSANTNAESRVPLARKVNGKPLSADITLGAGDVGAYTKAEKTDAKVSTATTAASNAAAAAGSANTNAESRVPLARKVNGKPLSADITLGAGDVGAYTKAETDTKVSAATTAASNAATAAASANTNAEGRVPSGRKVNNKPLTADITLSAGDVGALPLGGTAVAATKLAIARSINGVPFDGTESVTIPLSNLGIGKPSLCTAWVNFNGVNTVTVNGSHGISSVIRESTGVYTINFSTAMDTAVYAVICSVGDGPGQGTYAAVVQLNSPTGIPTKKDRNGVRVMVRGTGGAGDSSMISVAIFGGVAS